MEDFPILIPGRLALVVISTENAKTSRHATRLLLEMVARLSLHSSPRILDGGNSFNVHIVARTLAQHTQSITAALGRIQIARAFTCYQMLALLESTPADGAPTLVLDLLSTFYDENVPLLERQRLLSHCIGELQRLGRHSPVGISVCWSGARHPEAASLLETLEGAVDSLWRVESEQHQPPLRLF